MSYYEPIVDLFITEMQRRDERLAERIAEEIYINVVSRRYMGLGTPELAEECLKSGRIFVNATKISKRALN